jgi:pimeloyl-ACP methyl ester carboxylesterase
MDDLFAQPEKVPAHIKWLWLGTGLVQSPDDLLYSVTRPQDPTKLFEAGAQGLPLVIMQGTADRNFNRDVVAEEMRPSFTNMDVHTIEGGSHALFYDNQEEFVGILLEFVKKITQVSQFQSPI